MAANKQASKQANKQVQEMFEKIGYENFKLDFFIDKLYFCLLDLCHNYEFKIVISSLCSLNNIFNSLDYEKEFSSSQIKSVQMKEEDKKILYLIAFCYITKEYNEKNGKKFIQILDLLEIDNNEYENDSEFNEGLNQFKKYDIDSLRLIALNFEQKKKLSKAIEILQLSLSKNNDDFLSNYLIGKLYLERNEFELALKHFNHLKQIESKENSKYYQFSNFSEFSNVSVSSLFRWTMHDSSIRMAK